MLPIKKIEYFDIRNNVVEDFSQAKGCVVMFTEGEGFSCSPDDLPAMLRQAFFGFRAAGRI